MRKHTLLLCSLLPLLSAPLAQGKLDAQSPALDLNADSQESPLLMREFYPRWTEMDATQAVTEMTRLIAQANQGIAQITALKPAEMNYANTFDALSRVNEDVEKCFIAIYQLSTIADSPEVRAALLKLSELSEKHSASVIANEKLWQTIKVAAQQPWVATLDPERKRDVDKTLDGFRDSGADLSPEKKAELAKLKMELSQLSIKFNKNVLDSTNAWEHVVTDISMLKGMSDNWLARAAAAALKKGYGTKENPQWLIDLTFPSYGAIMSDCDVEATRRLCWQASIQIGCLAGFANEPLVHRIYELRHQIAQILGHQHYADLTTARRMAGTGAKALGFIDELQAKVLQAYKAENAKLLAFISERQGQKAATIHPWDRRYYSKEISLKENNFDSETLRPYLGADAMVEGMMDLYEELLGITIKSVPTTHLADKTQKASADQVSVWHPDVKLYEVYDSTSKQLLGAFYLDIYPRSTKRDGAWFMPIRMGESGRNGRAAYPHLGALVGNFSPPVNGGKALLSHYELVVLFHELGHTLHGMLSDTTLRGQAGTSVAWDFVEMPSQLFEYWAWTPEFLKKYARHHETGATIPDELIAKLRESKNYMPATQNMGQLNIAKLDLEFHMNYDKHFKGRTLNEATEKLLAPTSLPFSVFSPSLLHQLTHTMSGGYAAGYYSYKWAEVLSADAFSRFVKEGIMNKQTGASLRKEILSKGDSKPAAELYKNFMGREPDSDALLIDQGLLPAPAASK